MFNKERIRKMEDELQVAKEQCRVYEDLISKLSLTLQEIQGNLKTVAETQSTLVRERDNAVAEARRYKDKFRKLRLLVTPGNYDRKKIQ
jgi:hypothetical protein